MQKAKFHKRFSEKCHTTATAHGGGASAHDETACVRPVKESGNTTDSHRQKTHEMGKYCMVPSSWRTVCPVAHATIGDVYQEPVRKVVYAALDAASRAMKLTLSGVFLAVSGLPSCHSSWSASELGFHRSLRRKIHPQMARMNADGAGFPGAPCLHALKIREHLRHLRMK